jgi:Resolvase, N terminal domain
LADRARRATSHAPQTGDGAVYIRQSTPHQVVNNQESLRLQYALRQRARELGWHEADIDVIDADLGLSGASAAQRSGFKELVGRVGLSEVGLILSIAGYVSKRPSRPVVEFARRPEFIDERLEFGRIGVPSAEAEAVDGLTDLLVTCGAHTAA